jgi:cell division septal protein FtsQ
MARRVPQKTQSAANQSDSSLWLKKTAPKVVRKRLSLRQRFNNLFYKNFEAASAPSTAAPKRNTLLVPTLGALGIFLGIMITVIFIYSTYTNATFRMNTLKYSSQNKVGVEVKEYLNNHKFFQINTNDLEAYVSQRNPLIKQVYVNKSFFRGMILDVKEFEPVAVLVFKDENGEYSQRYFYTNDGTLIQYHEIQKLPVVLQFDGKRIQESPLDDYVRKSILTVEKLNTKGITGGITFDNFGNFSILTIDGKVIRLDLKEKYFNLDDQIKVIQNALVINANSSEFDLRFNYLVVKTTK